jgi:hypothetical protein
MLDALCSNQDPNDRKVGWEDEWDWGVFVSPRKLCLPLCITLILVRLGKFQYSAKWNGALRKIQMVWRIVQRGGLSSTTVIHMEHVNGDEVKTPIESMQTSLKLSTVRNVIHGALSGRVQPPKKCMDFNKTTPICWTCLGAFDYHNDWLDAKMICISVHIKPTCILFSQIYLSWKVHDWTKIIRPATHKPEKHPTSGDSYHFLGRYSLLGEIATSAVGDLCLFRVGRQHPSSRD